MSEKHDNVVDLLRRCIASGHGMAALRDRLGINPTAGWQTRCLAKVADMAEAEDDEWREIYSTTDRALYDEQMRGYGLIAKVEELEAKLADMERTHMKLPVDADGVPIRPGDEIEYDDPLYDNTRRCVVEAVCESSVFTDESYESVTACDCRHVKPDTVESLLEEALYDAATLDRNDGYWVSAADITNIVDDYAERIRKAVDHG